MPRLTDDEVHAALAFIDRLAERDVALARAIESVAEPAEPHEA